MGHFHTWIFIAFTLSLFSLFFMQLRSRWAALTQVFNTVSVSAFIVALILVRDYNYSVDFSLSSLDKRILLFAAVAHFLAQYFLFFKRNHFSPWWSFFGQLALWGLLIFMAAQNIVLIMCAYFLMALSLFTLVVRSPERNFLLAPSSYIKQTATLFFAGLSLILFILATGSPQLLTPGVLHQGLLYLSLCLFFIVIIFEADVLPLGENLLHPWHEHYSHLFYAQFIIKPALIWCLLTRFKQITNILKIENTLQPFLLIVCFAGLIFWIIQSFKKIDLRQRLIIMLKINYIIFFTFLILPYSFNQSESLAFSLLSIAIAAAGLLCIVFNQNMPENAIRGLYYKNRWQALIILFFSASLAGLPLTSSFYFRYISFNQAWHQSLPLLVFNLLATALLLMHFFFITKNLLQKIDIDTPAPYIEKYRFALLGLLFLVTLYGGFWPFMRL